jgi:CO/xanthine dehydrogenase FAD-binding subunit
MQAGPQFARPTTLDQALGLLAAGDRRILAGGTDVFPALGTRPLSEPVVDLSRLGAIRGIGVSDGIVRIGGATTWTDLILADLPSGFDGLKAAAREVGSIQIQNRGTIAGNICNASPAADGVPPLLALDASVELRSAKGLRVVPLAEFITGNRRTLRGADELVTAILVPYELAQSRSTFLKLGARRYLVISIAMIAVNLLTGADGAIATARVAVGSCSAVAKRLPSLEAALIGRKAAAGIGAVAEAGHLASLAPIDDLRASAAYRRDAALTLVRRALEACAAGDCGGMA